MLILIIACHPTQNVEHFGSVQLPSLISILTGDRFSLPATLKRLRHENMLKIGFVIVDTFLFHSDSISVLSLYFGISKCPGEAISKSSGCEKSKIFSGLCPIPHLEGLRRPRNPQLFASEYFSVILYFIYRLVSELYHLHQ